MPHPVFSPGRVAVITGAASGIGLAAAKTFAKLGMKVCLADVDTTELAKASESVSRLCGSAADVLAVPTDVRRPDELRSLKDKVYAAFGEVAFLMNNAATEGGGGLFGERGRWEAIIDVNLWGVVNGLEAFAPAIIEGGRDGIIVNTGSKQGITTPPGDTAYNVSKAGVKVVTEALAHELRSIEGCRITAHLLIPGFTFTGLTRARGVTEKPAGAWMPQQVVDFMMPALERGDFYILCPDNDVTREVDNKRIRWAAEDIVENRPALSRWHPAFKDAFDAFMKS
jgi:NAD(P)-dependent dehydrogenase (short-subunit alcohol dehydrogenase family)